MLITFKANFSQTYLYGTNQFPGNNLFAYQIWLTQFILIMLANVCYYYIIITYLNYFYDLVALVQCININPKLKCIYNLKYKVIDLFYLI